MSLIFLFIDGVGLAPAGSDNPLSDAPMPYLRALLGGPLTIEQATGLSNSVTLGPTWDEGRGTIENPHNRPSSIANRHTDGGVLLKPIDAALGVAGLPQSGTGHTALLAGVNAPALHGHHQPHFPPVALRPLLAERSIFRRVIERGGWATFANAFGPGYWEAVAARRIRRSASVIAAEGAGLRFRDGDDLRAGQAISWDVTGAAMRDRGVDAQIIAPELAGANLARLAHNHDLVFYESFLPDLAGHGRFKVDARHSTKVEDQPSDAGSSPVVRPSSLKVQIHSVMDILDGLIGGALAALRPADTLLVTSDHGNVESLAAPAHTRNPVPLLVIGPGVPAFTRVDTIAEVADAIVEVVF
jgi:2,3-bisphosphoglycerate-independent phosphoglycerate mutase